MFSLLFVFHYGQFRGGRSDYARALSLNGVVTGCLVDKNHHGFVAKRNPNASDMDNIENEPKRGHVFLQVQPPASFPNLTRPARGSLPLSPGTAAPSYRSAAGPPALALKSPPPVGRDEPGMPLSSPCAP